MKRVLLTGAGGFIGRHCLSSLVTHGYEVHAVSTRELHENHAGGIVWHRADLLNLPTLRPLLSEVCPTHLLHFAWYSVHGKFWTAPENLSWVRATTELLEAATESGCSRIVMAGTCAEYDSRFGCCSEAGTPCRPATLYGGCKLATQMVLEAWSRQRAFISAWGRIFFLYGPYENPSRLVSSVTLSLLANRQAQCTVGDQVRDYMHVQDVADAFVALLESQVTGPVNIGSGIPVAIKQIVQRIGSILEKPELIKLGAIETRPQDPPAVWADVARLQNEVGYRPRISLDTGLEQTISWLKTSLSQMSRR